MKRPVDLIQDPEIKRMVALRDKGQCPICTKDMEGETFRDECSLREYKISGLCQTCQDNMFQPIPIKVDPEPVDELSPQEDRGFTPRCEMNPAELLNKLLKPGCCPCDTCLNDRKRCGGRPRKGKQ